MVNRAAQYVETGQWKGNDRLVEGFARFVASVPGARPVLVLIDRGHSADVAQIRTLIASLGIEQHVIWLKGPQPYGFDRGELLPFYSVADVVADEFGIGWFGSVVVEGLSMGKPVLCYLDEDVMRQLYPWHPVLTPQTPDEIAACLLDLWRDPVERSRRGARGREWAVEFHSFQGASARYVLQVQQAVGTVHAGV
jgi:glycosyltransferase involved in cell wall biosynthesis